MRLSQAPTTNILFVALLYLLSFTASCISTGVTNHNSVSSHSNPYASSVYFHGRKDVLPRRYLRGQDSTPTSSVIDFLAHPLWVGASVSFATGYVVGTVCFLLWKIAARYCKTDDSEEEFGRKTTLFSPLIKRTEDLSFLEELEGDAKPALEILGRGGCGEVYKAELITGGRVVPIAIKMIAQPAANAAELCEEESEILSHRMRQIRSEILTVGRVRHPNLLRLLAHVPLADRHYLVYEYMKNGSLHSALRRAAEGQIVLSWPQRLRIALGVASGLEYLHMVHRPRIIHRDLKPANILLDHNLDARIADFGLAKVVPNAFSQPLMSSNIAGTVGYIAPEYYQTLSCTEKCDIYSFGVILAVLVTGRFPNDPFLQVTEEMCIVGWVRSAVSSENPLVAMDPSLLGNGLEEEMLLVLKIACFCTFDDPSERPNSRDVRCMLSQIKLGQDLELR